MTKTERIHTEYNQKLSLPCCLRDHIINLLDRDHGPARNAADRRIGSRGSGQARGAVIHSSAQVATVPERQFQRDSTASAFVRSCATRRPAVAAAHCLCGLKG